MGSTPQSLVKMTVDGVETHWLSGKGKVIGAAISYDNAELFLGMKGTITIHFLEKSVLILLFIANY